MIDENPSLTYTINLLGYFAGGWIFGYTLRHIVDYLKDRYKK